jgi:hypothetical protein
MKIEIPQSLKAEHDELHADLSHLTQAGGHGHRVGDIVGVALRNTLGSIEAA